MRTSPTKRSSDFIAHLDDCLRRPEWTSYEAVGAGRGDGLIDVNKLALAALEVQHWLTVEWAAKIRAELNDIEVRLA